MRWAAPLFVKVRVCQAGFCFGYSRSLTYGLIMTDRTLQQLEQGSHPMYGIDQTFAVPHTTTEQKSDVIALSVNDSSDIVVSSVVQGMMLDFSFAGGSMTPDMAMIHQVYGESTTVHDVLRGSVPPPPEMVPLYDRLASTLVVSAVI